MSVLKEDVSRSGHKTKSNFLADISKTEHCRTDAYIQSEVNSVGSEEVETLVQTDREQKPSPKEKEWRPSKRWNPFNSYKLLAHVGTWRNIKRCRPMPAPILITVDPTNLCNLNCVWCNAEFVRNERKNSLSRQALLSIADFLPQWSKEIPYESGVKAVCVAGGGEPLLNPATGEFIDRLVAHDIEVGVVTNGTKMNKFVDSLSQAVWVGVSVDAATKSTFNKLKRLPPSSDLFDQVIDNIAVLVDYSLKHNNRLGYRRPSYGVSYKYLLYKENIGQVYEAAKLAREIGCKNIHFRPAGTTWDKLGTEKEIVFGQDEVKLFNEQIAKAMELDNDDFGVYGITHKFNSQFERANYFSACHAVFMTAVIEPPVGKDAHKDSFVVGLCCDRRGDAKLELARNIIDVNEIQKLWGSEKHWKIHDEIAVDVECPRCTYQPHNEVYEQVILNDSMTYKFI